MTDGRDPEDLDSTVADGAGEPDTEPAADGALDHQDDLADLDLAGSRGEQPGDRIDRYGLIEEVGQGGMGTVWRAEQREPVRREVALKVIKLGMDTREVVARFEAERQALALFDHPNIAKVFDAGATSSGRPYFVMELVRGVPLTEYCDAAGLDLRRRLELFVDVCQAIQHAHQKGVIHRDIKPSNVLVSDGDGGPVVKVIDFGIAKATGASLEPDTMLTRAAQVIGTPAYMSPEQAAPGDRGIDTRADIYSLGVLLYELLTGQTPFDVMQLLNAGFDELLRTIREVEPLRPSTRVSSAAATVQAPAGGAVDVRALSRQLRGELDWIVMKALEKDRSRRYGSASEFAEDVQRHLRHEPVEAGPPGAGYRLRKALRRHRSAVLAGSVIVLLLIGSSVAGTLGWLHVREINAELAQSLVGEERQRSRAEGNEREARSAQAAAERSADEARSQTRRAESARDLMKSMLAGVGPRAAVGADTALLRYLLDDASVRLLDGELDDERVTAELLLDIGASLLDCQDFEGARRNFDAAVSIGRSVEGEFSDVHFAALLQQIRILQWQSDHAAVVERLEVDLPRARTTLGTGHRLVLEAELRMATSLANVGQADRSEALFESCIAAGERILEPDDPDMIGLQVEWLGNALTWRTTDEELAARAREELQRSRRVLGGEHVLSLSLELLLAMHDRACGRMAESAARLERIVPVYERTLGAGHYDTVHAKTILAQTEWGRNELERALGLFREVIEDGSETLSPTHERVRSARLLCAAVLDQVGRHEEARELAEQNLESDAQLSDRASTRRTRWILLQTCSALGDLGRVDELLEEGWVVLDALVEDFEEGRVQAIDQELSLILQSVTNAAANLNEHEAHETALELVAVTLPILRQLHGPTHPWTSVAAMQRARALDAIGDPDDAIEAWRDYWALRVAAFDEDPGWNVQACVGLALEMLNATQQESVDDEALLRVATAATVRSRRQHFMPLAALAEALIRLERQEEAIEVLEEGLTLSHQTPDGGAAFRARIAECRAALEQRDD